jgi:hypothetical protein
MSAPRDDAGAREPLRLRAVDTEDLVILSTYLQDALVLVSDIAYQAPEHRFVLLANRYRWEAGEGARVAAGLTVDHVVAVKRRGIDQGRTSRFLSLLALRHLPDEGVIELAFSGGGAIRLEVSGILCHLQDLGEPWPAAWRPHHEQEP